MRFRSGRSYGRGMDVQFVAGFGPITRQPAEGLDFWGGRFGIDFEELAPDYHHARDLPGAKVFGLWPLAQAAEATWGTSEWPADVPVPQAWLEFELASPQAVVDGSAELEAQGQVLVTQPHEEPWGQWTARLLSPEGLLVGLSWMPAFH